MVFHYETLPNQLKRLLALTFCTLVSVWWSPFASGATSGAVKKEASKEVPACSDHRREYQILQSGAHQNAQGDSSPCGKAQKGFQDMLRTGARACALNNKISDLVAATEKRGIASDDACDETQGTESLAELNRAILANESSASADDIERAKKFYSRMVDELTKPAYQTCSFFGADGELDNVHFRVMINGLNQELSNPTHKEVKAKKGELNRRAMISPVRKALGMMVMTVAGAFFRRFHGGMFPTGSTFLARLGATAVMAGAGWMVGGPDGMVAGGLMYIGSTVPTFGAITGGVGENRTIAGDMALNSLRGAIQMALPMAYLQMRGYDAALPMMLGGAMSGPCYYGAHQVANEWKFLDKKPYEVVDGAGGTSELCAGAFYGLGMGYTLTFGQPKEKTDWLGIGSFFDRNFDWF